MLWIYSSSVIGIAEELFLLRNSNSTMVFPLGSGLNSKHNKLQIKTSLFKVPSCSAEREPALQVGEAAFQQKAAPWTWRVPSDCRMSGRPLLASPAILIGHQGNCLPQWGHGKHTGCSKGRAAHFTLYFVFVERTVPGTGACHSVSVAAGGGGGAVPERA